MSNWGTNPKLPPLLGGGQRSMTYSQAIAEAMQLALEHGPGVRVFGEGVTDKGGTYGTTRGLEERFGPRRVFDVPVAEGLITGLAVGMALGGLRPIAIHPRNDFVLLALDQLCNHAAKWATMFGGKSRCPLVIRSVSCRGWGSAAQHSQALHAMLAQFPGLTVAVPFTPADAKAMLLWAALESDGPVAIMEHKYLWNLSGDVPAGLTFAPPDGPAIVRAGCDVTLVGISFGAAQAMMAAEKLAEQSVQAEVIDLRWLRPLNVRKIVESVRKTGRLVVVDTAHASFGASGEVIASVAQALRPAEWKAAPARVALPDEPTPGSNEDRYFPGADDIVASALRVMSE